MKKNKPARWEFLDELDGRTVDDTPIRKGLRKPMPWEIFLYVVAVILLALALYALLAHKVGATGFSLLCGASLFLRALLYELKRRVRCKTAMLGTVESFTRNRRFRKNTRYPVVCFEVDETVYRTHSAKPAHPSTKGNEEWIRYNSTDPEESFVAADSKPILLFLLTAATAFLGVAFLIWEMS